MRTQPIAGTALSSFVRATAVATLGTVGRPPAAAHTATPARVAARRLSGAAALLATTALTDSAIEHYRGSFHNKAMILPLVVAAETLGVSLHGTADRHGGPSATRNLGHALAAATGVIGTGFHLYNITKRPGGWSWINLFYAAPLGAPAALSLAGALGGVAERLRDTDRKVWFGLLRGKLICVSSPSGYSGPPARRR